MITDFQTSRRGGKLRVSLRLSNGNWGHGEGCTVKAAKLEALKDAMGKEIPETLVWRPDAKD